MRRKAVFLDIDGTLLGRGRRIAATDLKAMEEAAAKGHFIFLNTGRSLGNIPPFMLEIPFLKGIVAGGGAHVLLAGKRGGSSGGSSGFRTIYRKWFSARLLSMVFAWYKNKPRSCVLEGERNCYIINKTTWSFPDKAPEYVKSYADFKRKSSGDHITKLTLDSLAREDERLFFGAICTVNCFPEYTELLIKGENKAKAMQIVLDKLGMEREDSVAIGDSINDLEMIKFAGTGIAMGNACAELKAAASAITAACGKGGVAKAIRKYVIKISNEELGMRDSKK